MGQITLWLETMHAEVFVVFAVIDEIKRRKIKLHLLLSDKIADLRNILSLGSNAANLATTLGCTTIRFHFILELFFNHMEFI